jgi:dipeptidyl aminopeptidase/acylaminoacyl peptidase
MKTLTLFLVLAVALIPVSGAAANNAAPGHSLGMFQGSLSGGIVYTADSTDTNSDGIIDAADNDIMYSSTIGASPTDGRFSLVGGPDNSAAYPRLSNDGEIILCHAFVDTNGDGRVSEETDTPLLGALNIDGSDLVALSQPGAVGALEGSWSPDQTRIAFSYIDTDTDGDGILTTRDIRKLAVMEIGAIDPASPTASQMAQGSDFRVVTDTSLSVSRPQFWAENLVIFSATRTSDNIRQVYSFNLDTNALETFAPPEGESFNPVPSPDRSRLAVEVQLGEDQYVAVYDGAVDRWVRASPEGTQASDPSWSSDGALVMAVRTATGSQVVLYQNRQLSTVMETTDTVSLTQFSPDGNAIAYAAVPPEGGNTVVKVMTLDGGYAATLTPPDSNVSDFVWVPEGQPEEEENSSLPLPDFAALLPSSPLVHKPQGSLAT